MKLVLVAMFAALCGLMCNEPPQSGDAHAAVSAVLDSLHDAASKADGERYFSNFAENAVFLGTDATERWTIDQFKTYAMERFATGKGWTYDLVKGSRHIDFSDDGTVAWFDELLSNAKYGTCRGSGVLVKKQTQWKITQYNLAFTIPNEAAGDVVAVIQRKSNAGASQSRSAQ